MKAAIYILTAAVAALALVCVMRHVGPKAKSSKGWDITENHLESTAATVIHSPNGKCPPGWQYLPDFFTRKDGTKCGACAKPGEDVVIDRLNPGESVALGGAMMCSPRWIDNHLPIDATSEGLSVIRLHQQRERWFLMGEFCLLALFVAMKIGRYKSTR